METDLMLSVLFRMLNLTILVTGAIAFCGSLLLIIGDGVLEKANVLFNKKIVSIGPYLEKMDKNILAIDAWIMKRPRLVGSIVLVVSVGLFLNMYIRVG